MTFLNTSDIDLFKNLTDINDGFRIPDQAFIFGKDFECFEELGGDAYFSNYWYGKKENAQEFAEKLANYFQTEYQKIPKKEVAEEESYDFQGMIVLWDLGENAVVGNINLLYDLAFFQHENEIPPALESSLKASKLKLLLSDGNDNSVSDIIFSDVSNKIKSDIFQCVSENSKEDFLSSAEDGGIKLKLPNQNKSNKPK